MATLKDKLTAAVVAHTAEIAASEDLAAKTAARDASRADLDAKTAADATASADALAVMTPNATYDAGNGQVAVKIDGAFVLGPLIDPATVTVPDTAPPAAVTQG